MRLFPECTTQQAFDRCP